MKKARFINKKLIIRGKKYINKIHEKILANINI